jgi:hypothetical protein
MPIIYKDEGMNGFYKGLVPLWMRQIPYTMMKFACFEKTIELLYRYIHFTCTTFIYIVVSIITANGAAIWAKTNFGTTSHHHARSMRVVLKIRFPRSCSREERCYAGSGDTGV